MQTISLLGYLHEFRGIIGPHLVVAPKSTLGNWMKEIRRFCPVLRAVKFLGNPDERVSQKACSHFLYKIFAFLVAYLTVLNILLLYFVIVFICINPEFTLKLIFL